VRVIVDGRPASIDPRLTGMDRLERLGLAGQAVEQRERVWIGHTGRIAQGPAKVKPPRALQPRGGPAC